MIRYTEPFSKEYNLDHDNSKHWAFMAAPCAVVALITSFYLGFDFIEFLWYMSIFLEALAICPQLILLQRYKDVENLTGHYVFLLGAYRALYIVNWVYRAYTELYYKHNWVVYSCGVIQTVLYLDFFYYYLKSKSKGEGSFQLPR
jgi:ER lumen protein retaining receptor